MRRMIITAVATVSLAAPSAALAHNGARHHHHRGRNHHAHVLAFHAQVPAGSTTTGTTAPSSTPSSSDSAGTIASFTGGVLTITMSDGSTVSGKVTERTEIECPAPSSVPAPTTGSSSFGEREHGDDGHFNNSNDGSNSGADGEGQGGCPGHEGDGEGGEHCTSAALVPGASVKEAFLSVSNEGATWVKVEL